MPRITSEQRQEFNRAAVRLGLPLFQKDGGAIVVLDSPLPWSGDLVQAVAQVRAEVAQPTPLPEGLEPAERARREAVLAELDAGRPTLILSELTTLSRKDRDFVRHMKEAARRVEHLHWLQRGVAGQLDEVPADDGAGRSLFVRNQSPSCERSDCSVLPGGGGVPVDLYPADLQQDEGFCERLAIDHPDVMQPFMVAREVDGALQAVPYSQAWPEASQAAAASLRDAAGALDADREGPLVAYLTAAAHAFEHNDWYEADKAWAAMNQRNSAWYVRVGPDETYWEPCSEHAGYHLQLAQVNPAGIAWQDKLAPVKQDMETAVAALAGPPYAARTVGFELPEFIDIVINAGDARSALGGTVGQSLPNWGPVASEGGRTVAMTNIGVDADSVAAREASLAAVMCPALLDAWPRDPEPQLVSTVLHEAGHNLGPSHAYAVDGQVDTDRFGGPLASMLEELKAQTLALVLPPWLAERGLIDADQVHAMAVADVAWALGKIAEGMTDPSGRPNAYPQLAAVQVGSLLDAGALVWRTADKAANETDVGCLDVVKAKLPDAVDALGRQVLGIKARGDRAAAEALRDRYTAPDGDFAAWRKVVEERMRRQARPSYVYRVVVD